MVQVFFLLFAFLTVILSNKLSYYADLMSKTTKISGAFIGGILLAGITSLPEFVTCFSSIYLDNVYLATGDILGSNLFNIFIICFFDIIFLNRTLFLKTKKQYLIYIILLIDYFFVYLSLRGIVNLSIFNIGIASVIIFINYFLYLYFVSRNDDKQEKSEVFYEKNVVFKFILTAFLIVIVSILLTITVNKIASLSPTFSASFIGAILLGIITSLPEVITFLGLIRLKNYDMALSDIIGSNLFNLLVLALGDMFLKGSSIYFFADSSVILILILCFLTTIVNWFQNLRNKSHNKLLYLFPSFLILLFYLYFIVINLTK